MLTGEHSDVRTERRRRRRHGDRQLGFSNGEERELGFGALRVGKIYMNERGERPPEAEAEAGAKSKATCVRAARVMGKMGRCCSGGNWRRGKCCGYPTQYPATASWGAHGKAFIPHCPAALATHACTLRRAAGKPSLPLPPSVTPLQPPCLYATGVGQRWWLAASGTSSSLRTLSRSATSMDDGAPPTR